MLFRVYGVKTNHVPPCRISRSKVVANEHIHTHAHIHRRTIAMLQDE